jgi:hypothetical protein
VVRSIWACAANALVTCMPPFTTMPGGNPVTAVPGLRSSSRGCAPRAVQGPAGKFRCDRRLTRYRTVLPHVRPDWRALRLPEWWL